MAILLVGIIHQITHVFNLNLTSIHYPTWRRAYVSSIISYRLLSPNQKQQQRRNNMERGKMTKRVVDLRKYDIINQNFYCESHYTCKDPPHSYTQLVGIYFLYYISLNLMNFKFTKYFVAEAKSTLKNLECQD